jgi:hypothetical protein
MEVYKIACLKMEINDLVMQKYFLENLFVIPVVIMEDEEDEISLAHVVLQVPTIQDRFLQKLMHVLLVRWWDLLSQEITEHGNVLENKLLLVHVVQLSNGVVTAMDRGHQIYCLAL